MPLRVHCPSGCFIRMPANRAGKIVRCPECKRIIRLHSASKSEITSGKPIPMTATIVEDQIPADEADASGLPSIDQTSKDLPAGSLERPRLVVPEKIAPPSVRVRKHDGDSTESKRGEASADSSTETPVEYASLGDDPVIADFAAAANKRALLQRRVKASNADRRIVSRFFAVCLCVVALVNFGPAIYYWSNLLPGIVS